MSWRKVSMSLGACKPTLPHILVHSFSVFSMLGWTWIAAYCRMFYRDCLICRQPGISAVRQHQTQIVLDIQGDVGVDFWIMALK